MILLKLGILNFFGAKEQDKWVVSEIFNMKPSYNFRVVEFFCHALDGTEKWF